MQKVVIASVDAALVTASTARNKDRETELAFIRAAEPERDETCEKHEQPWGVRHHFHKYTK